MAAWISMEALLKSIECLSVEQKVIVPQGLLLQNTPVAKEPVKEAVAPAKKEETKKSKKEKDPNAPKKEASWWAKGTNAAKKPAEPEKAAKAAEPEKIADTFTFEGKVYNTMGKKPEDGCFLYDGEECAGFFFEGALDTEIKA